MIRNLKKLFVILLIAILVVALAISTIIVVACDKLTRQEEIAEEGITEVTINNKQYTSGENTTVVETWDISATESDSVTATLYSDGKLVISGTGAMKNWSFTSSAAWDSYGKDIKTVEISQGVTNIGSNAFLFSSLTSITIPNSVTMIGNYAFSQCGSLASITIPDSVASIGSSAFYMCSSLTSVDIPSSVTSIEDNPFVSCSNLTAITVEKNNEKYCSIDGILFNKDVTTIECYPAGKDSTTYTIPNSVTSIGSSAFQTCKNLTSITIPDSVMSIESYAFSGCSSLTSIEILEGVTSIGAGAFSSCSSLTSIGIPEGVTSIEVGAFEYCSSLTSIEIPDSVTRIGHYAFANCSSLTAIKVEENNEKYCSIDGVLFDKDKTTIICYPVGKSGTKYTIPSSVIEIGSYAFYKCSSLTSIEISDGVTSIEDRAFYQCSSLASINIPDGVTRIEDWAFYKCNSLTSINIPESVTSIGKYAFYGCKDIETVQIGEYDNGEITIDLPELVQRTLDENDILYANGTAPTLTNCTIEDNKVTFKVEDIIKQNVKIYINSGALAGVTVVVVVPSGTILYNKTSWTNQDVVATIFVEDGETITNNNGSNTYTFTKNGEYTFTYTDKNGEAQSSTAKVDWIDKDAPTVSVSGNATSWTKGDVTIKITATDSGSGLATQPYSFDGGTTWTSSNTKTYSQNTSGIVVKVKDALGNIATASTINITKIDKTAPTISVSGNATSWTKDNVTLKITASDSGSGLATQPYSFDGGTTWQSNNTKTYSQNTSGIVIKVKDAAGNITTAETINITKIVKFTSSTYTIGTSNIKQVQPKTTVKQFKENITTNVTNAKVYNASGTELKDTDIIGTNMTLKLEDISTYTLIVKGDCTGDGQANLSDMLAINKYRLGKATLTANYLSAADTNGDGKVDLSDILQINKYRLGKTSSL